MLILENIGLALNAIRANISRSILTMLGIIIGVAAVIGILTISDAMDSELSGVFADGLNIVSVGVTDKSDGNDDEREMFDRRRRQLGMDDYIDKEIIDDVLDRFSDRIYGYSATASVAREATAVVDGKTSTVNITGVNKEQYKSFEEKIVAGHEIYDSDYEDGKRVALVSTKLTDALYKGKPETAIGQNLSVLVNNVYHTYNIIGVYDGSTNSEFVAFDSEDVSDIYIPLVLAMGENHMMYKFSNIEFCAYDYKECDNLAAEIQKYVNGKYYAANNDYEVETFSALSMIEEVSSMMSNISLGLSCIAGISLLVGGIGVMNIMLVSITERTKEIGTRKALGATNSSIRIQFVVEAIVLCLVGGLIGIIVGEGLGYIGCKLMESTFVFTLKSILISFGFAAAVGIFFGYYPANKAAKMNPIDALRYE